MGQKRKAWTVSDTLAAVARVRAGESQAKLSRELSVAESTLRGWLKEEEKLKEFVDNLDESSGLARKRARMAQDQDLDTVVFKWFVKQQATAGVPMSGPIIVAQAEIFDRQLNGENSTFKASKGWLWRFCKRHGIGQIAVSGEIRSADDDAATSFPAKLKELIEE